MHALGVRYEPGNIEAAIATAIQASNGIDKDIALCSTNVRELASGLTRIPLAVITHAIVNRAARLKGDKAFYETTLELLQHVSIASERGKLPSMVVIQSHFRILHLMCIMHKASAANGLNQIAMY